MSLTAGIIGLPNVGKSTLFNAITASHVLAQNYPFATIEPNVGVVLVKDNRLNVLNQMYKPKSLVPTTFEFTDIAGLVKGASKGEGLGNQFLANIRTVDAIIHVVRCFDDSNIIHVNGAVDPIGDIEVINLELILADLEIVEKRIPKIEKKAQAKDAEAVAEYEILKKIRDVLLSEKFVSSLLYNEEELKIIKHFNFLTLKPMMLIGNVKEDDLFDLDGNKHYQNLKKYAKENNYKAMAICAKLEEELLSLEEEERLSFLNQLGIENTYLDTLIKEAYDLLGLQTFLTAGEKEVRAWTFKKGMKAPQCAGIIHTDFQKGFIRAEVVSYDDLIEAGSINNARLKGKVRQEGKEYVFNDGDVVLFKFNV